MDVLIITDCYDTKKDAIHGVFSRRFGTSSMEIVTNKKEAFITPMDEEGFSFVIAARLSVLKLTNDEADFYVSIQKGYYYKNSLWHFTAIVGIMSKGGLLVDAKTSSVPLPRISSDKKTANPKLNMSDILAEEFPWWNKEKDSVYGLLTNGENEKDWLQQPLRDCLYHLLRQKV